MEVFLPCLLASPKDLAHSSGTLRALLQALSSSTAVMGVGFTMYLREICRKVPFSTLGTVLPLQFFLVFNEPLGRNCMRLLSAGMTNL